MLSLVSIVVCTYNGEKYLAQQLDSLVCQSYKNIEIIVCDDGSNDGTLAVAENYKAAYSYIKVYQNDENLGYNKNFMRGFELATGNVIAICDQDDIWHEEKITIMMDAWKSEFPMIYCDSKMFTADIPLNPIRNKRYRRFEGTDIRKIALFNTVSGHAILFKKNLLPLINQNLPGNMIYDWYMAMVAASNGGVQYVDQILVFQRRHALNATGNKSFGYRDKQYRTEFNKRIENHLSYSLAIPNLSPDHKIFLQKLLTLWKSAMQHKFSNKLFSFLFINREIIFDHKPRKFGYLSHGKHAYYLAKNISLNK